jgi:putative hydrolase of the HAD superfamily
MPGMKEVIAQLSERNIPLGIISNAQFYTPLIMNFFLHGKLTDDEVVHPFDKDLTVYSYQHKRSKPDDFLFEIVKRQCKEKYNIHASEILFLGNDMFRDIYPAHRAGFKTALFAGDSRSLRLRKDNPELDHIAPDHIITDLYQLLKIIT